MSSNNKIAQVTLASIVALTTMGADTPPTTNNTNFVKCYGVAAAGKNDCGTVISACSGTVKVDRACYAWVYMPEGICKKLAGASLNKPEPNCKSPDGKSDSKK